ncbi:MAG TPA: hypothetical protein VJM10_04030, partial [Candidatus Methylomirabilis sp.]|nr:hypothetical protein [Candidatus Methylomirabilis sp.]
MTWYRDSIASALDDMVASWEWICAHTEFAAAKLSFRLDSLNRCGIGHSIRGDAGGQDEDLTRAEACWRLALTLAPLGLPDRLRYLHNLGTAALQRYHRTSAREQLADAIEHFNQALADVGPSDDEAPLYHDSLAVALTYQYDRQGTIDDLEGAIAHGETAVELAPPGTPGRGRYVSHLGGRYRLLHLRSRSPWDINRSVHLLELAVEQARDSELPARLTNLGSALLQRYEILGDRVDLERSIVLQQQAVGKTSDGDPSLPSRVNNLGNGLRQRYDQERNPSDIDEVVKTYGLAVQLTLPTDPQLTSRVYNLANSLRERFQRKGEQKDFQEAVRRYREACTTGLDYDLEWALGAARTWGIWAEERQDWGDSSEAYAYGLQALNRLYREQLLVEHKQSWLREARDLGGHAAYVLARVGHLAKAVETLEQNRARVLSEELRYQDVARDTAPTAEGAAFLSVRERIAALEAKVREPKELDKTDFLRTLTDLRAAHSELSSIAGRIHQDRPKSAPGSLTIDGITAIARELGQPIVYLITAIHGSLGLIVPPMEDEESPRSARVEPVWLDKIKVDTLNEMLYDHDHTRRYLHASVLGDIELLARVLEDIWPVLADGLMQPIAGRLADLGFDRALLVLAGTLSLLPVHALASEKLVAS